ncbi:MAG: hypothetical protein WCG25_03880 [bacterium]
MAWAQNINVFFIHSLQFLIIFITGASHVHVAINTFSLSLLFNTKRPNTQFVFISSHIFNSFSFFHHLHSSNILMVNIQSVTSFSFS